MDIFNNIFVSVRECVPRIVTKRLASLNKTLHGGLWWKISVEDVNEKFFINCFKSLAILISNEWYVLNGSSLLKRYHTKWKLVIHCIKILHFIDRTYVNEMATNQRSILVYFQWMKDLNKTSLLFTKQLNQFTQGFFKKDSSCVEKHYTVY